ncbi:MAG TPA: GNAT family N-acetyltransferase [Tissierellia bacterium]|nr:GNAT family N-acetyltransferase [Tissierellia bacterium]
MMRSAEKRLDAISIREAKREDVPRILDAIKGLAAYEKMSDDVVATEEILEEWLFDKKKATVLLADYDGQPAGFALYFTNFSTFLGRAGLYLEDLFIHEEFRGKGIGGLLLKRLAKIARDEGYGRFEWVCLDWNKPAIDYYLDIGAVAMDEWTIYRMDQKRLTEFAEE